MKHLAKACLRFVAPQWTTAWLSARARAHSHRVVADWGCGKVNAKLIERLGNRVCAGPFAGLVLTPMTFAEQIGPYLLGVYETELLPAWETVFRGTYAQIVDIGAKFGYYAVGLAKRYPQASVVAFDTDWWARQALAEMAGANDSDNLIVEGFCTSRRLAERIDPSALILCDAEGYEAELFGPDVMRRLPSCTLIIETHDCFVPGVSERLRSAFLNTHHVHVLPAAEMGHRSSLPLDFLSDSERMLAEREVRPAQCWLLCLPKMGPNRMLVSIFGGRPQEFAHAGCGSSSVGEADRA